MAECLMKGADGLFYKVTEAGAVRCPMTSEEKSIEAKDDSAEFPSMLRIFDGNGTDFSAAGHAFSFEVNDQFMLSAR